ncbi:MAG: class IIb bacteriocin, lactobin A/cerein 7B family [Cyanobium sp.]
MNTVIEKLIANRSQTAIAEGSVQELTLDELEAITGGAAPLLLLIACVVLLALPASAGGGGQSGPPVNSLGNGTRVDTNTSPSPSLAFPAPVAC